MIRDVQTSSSVTRALELALQRLQQDGYPGMVVVVDRTEVTLHFPPKAGITPAAIRPRLLESEKRLLEAGRPEAFCPQAFSAVPPRLVVAEYRDQESLPWRVVAKEWGPTGYTESFAIDVDDPSPGATE